MAYPEIIGQGYTTKKLNVLLPLFGLVKNPMLV